MTLSKITEGEIEKFIEAVVSVVEPKIIWTIVDGNLEEIDVTIFEDGDVWVYEIALSDYVDASEGSEITEILSENIESDFDFEIFRGVEDRQ